MALGPEEQVWLQVEKDHRKAVQKAAKRGIEVREAVTLEDFREFERVQLEVFRDFGTPPYGSNYFPALWRKLQPQGQVKILLSYVDGKCAGGLVLFGWGKNLISKFAACLPHAGAVARLRGALLAGHPARHPTRLRAIELGNLFPRDQTGLIEFKERWGAVTRPAVLYSLPVSGGIPDISKYYDSTGIERRIWRKLPIPLTQAGGRVLSRWFCWICNRRRFTWTWMERGRFMKCTAGPTRGPTTRSSRLASGTRWSFSKPTGFARRCS